MRQIFCAWNAASSISNDSKWKRKKNTSERKQWSHMHTNTYWPIQSWTNNWKKRSHTTNIKHTQIFFFLIVFIRLQHCHLFKENLPGSFLLFYPSPFGLFILFYYPVCVRKHCAYFIFYYIFLSIFGIFSIWTNHMAYGKQVLNGKVSQCHSVYLKLVGLQISKIICSDVRA